MGKARPTYEAAVEGGFAARHAARLADGGFEPSHGHDWHVTAVFRADRLDGQGFVVDFLAVQAALRALAADLDGADLNELFTLGGASAERVAQYLAEQLAARLGHRPYCVQVSEAPGCRAAYYPAGA